MKLDQRSEVVRHRDINSPWGKSWIVDQGSDFSIRRISINPALTLSLQYHGWQPEYWVIMSGDTTVTTDGSETNLGAGDRLAVIPDILYKLTNDSHRNNLEVVEIRVDKYMDENQFVILDNESEINEQ